MGRKRAIERGPELRKLPQVERVAEALGGDLPHALRVAAAQAVLDEARQEVLDGSPAPAVDDLLERSRARLRDRARRRLVPVVNATGVLLHTNLGRAPLGNAATKAIAGLATGYSNLEYDLARAARGSRYEHATDLLRSLTGAEAALVVNNNAAAVLLTLAALARGREVIISRGELIEIGGEFRIPEILAESGAALVEVGTTNRTHLKDYERAVTPATAAIMKVHPSNYRVVGFSAAVASADLVDLAHARGLRFIYDVGSGLLRRRVGGAEPPWLAGEPIVGEEIARGADVVTFSGDKLLGGPQAGMILGRAEALARMQRSPLLRAVRVDKTTLAALEATLLSYLAGSETDLPIWELGLADAGEIETRARAVVERLGDVAAKIEVTAGFSTTGGGAGPGSEIPTALIEVAPRHISPDALLRSLIDHDPPVVTRIENDRVIVDLRTVLPDQDGIVASALRGLLEPARTPR